MNLNYLLQYCQTKISQYQSLKEEIESLYILAVNEVQNGESEAHEVELAISEIDDIIEEFNSNTN